jgi:predicted ATP-grasp superfamily ATP-dependent carboligase
VRRVVLIADEYYASLAAVRALQAGGYETTVASTTDDGYAQRSRAARRVVRVPETERGDAFVAAVAALARDADLVLAGTEAATVALAGREDAVAPARLGTPAPEAVRRLGDKQELGGLAAAAGLATPGGVVVEAGADAPDVAFPVVLKPVRSAETTGDGTVQLPLAVAVDDAAELRERITARPDVTWLVQPYLTGPLIAVAGVSAGGDTLCTVHQTARRIFPRDAGVSAFAETIPLDATLDERVRDLLACVGFTGIWEAQFILQDGRHHLIDLNPRMYGSLGLAVAAGANLPALLADVLLGEQRRACTYRAGVGFRAEMRELGVVADAVRGRDLATVRSVLTPRRDTAHAVLSLRDPGPALLLARRAVTRALG